MKYETAGDPMTGLRWTRKTREKIADELTNNGFEIGKTTVGKILKKIAAELTRREIPTKTGRSNRWTHQVVGRILKRPGSEAVGS